jgi:hypothetical protein
MENVKTLLEELEVPFFKNYLIFPFESHLYFFVCFFFLPKNGNTKEKVKAALSLSNIAANDRLSLALLGAFPVLSGSLIF